MYREADRLSPMILAAGYYSTMVPTNAALMCHRPGGLRYGPNLKYVSYDLDKELGLETEDERRRRNLIRQAEELRREEEEEKRKLRREEEEKKRKEENERRKRKEK